MAFNAIRREKAYMQIADQIIASIRRGEFSVGERLPSVRELEAKFGVSRPTVREALSALELAGTVEVRTGQGAYVKQSPGAGGPAVLTAEVDVGVSPAEVLEVRLVLEPEAARLAATRATEDEHAELTRVLEALERTLGKGTLVGAGDFEFHLAVARASGNGMIVEFMHRVGTYLNQALWAQLRERAWTDPDLGRKYLEEDRKTVSHIRARDGAGAARSMREHLNGVQHDLFSDS